MALPKLNQGTIMQIFNNVTGIQPIVQVTEIRRIGNESSKADRYRLVISDGQHYQQAMLATQLNEMVKNDVLQKFALIHITEYICNLVQNRRIVIILNMTIAGACDHRIGDPVAIDGDGSSNTAAPAAAPVPTPAPAPAPVARPAPQQAPAPAYQAPPQPTFQQQPQFHQQQQQSGRGPMAQTDYPAVQPISSLNPYQQNRWTIKARIISKGTLRHYKNERGEGKVCSIDMMDDSGEIRGTFFNSAVDKFLDQIQADKVYVISSKGQLKIANKRFSSVKNEYEITFSDDSQFIPVPEDSSAPKMRYNFVNIDQLENVPNSHVIDIIGVVEQVFPPSSITVKQGVNAGRQVPKRTVKIVDDSNKTVELTLWDENIQKVSEEAAEQHLVVAIRCARVSDFGGRSLSSTRESHIELSPDVPEGHKLRGWYDGVVAQGGSHSFTTISGGGMGGGGGGGNTAQKTFAQIKDEKLGLNEKPDYFKVRGTITFVKHDERFSYPACPSADHKSKVTQQPSGQWHCEKCNLSYPNCEHRYILSVTGSDHTSSAWLSAFNDIGVKLLGRTADELHAMRESGQDAEFESVFQNALFRQFIFKIRAKNEQYNDENRVKCSVIECEPVNFAVEGHRLLEEIRAME